MTAQIYDSFKYLISEKLSSIRENSFRKPRIVKGYRNRYTHVRLKNSSRQV